MSDSKLNISSLEENNSYNFQKLSWVIICLGILLRLAQYLYNRSLWLDEAMLSSNFVNKTFAQLLQPLDYSQVAPLGFLLSSRLLVEIFGTSEYVLRLFPLLAGVLSLLLFYKVARSYIDTKAILIALVLFALSDRLIYYASEAKQYSSDVAVGLVLYWVIISLQTRHLTAWRIFLFGITGALAAWFSHPVVFVMAGGGAATVVFCLMRRQWPKVRRLLIVYFIWLSSFLICYFSHLRTLSNNEMLVNYWKGRKAFMPLIPQSISDISWFFTAFIKNFSYSVGIYFYEICGIRLFPPGLNRSEIPANISWLGYVIIGFLAVLLLVTLAVFLLGAISMWTKQKEKFFILLTPALLTLLASGFHKYLFDRRMLLFLVPVVLLFMAQGATYLTTRARFNTKTIKIALIGLLFLNPVLCAGYHLIKPRCKEEIKQSLNYVRKHWHENDLLCLYRGARAAFAYYGPRYHFQKNDYIMGICDRDNTGSNIVDWERFHGRERIWLLFSHPEFRKGIADEDMILEQFDEAGIRLDAFNDIRTSVYLYGLDKLASPEQ